MYVVVIEPHPALLGPFAILLLSIAIFPLILRQHWERHYQRLCALLAATTSGYYVFALHGRDLGRLPETAVPGLLDDPAFLREFAALHRYYREARLLQLRHVDGKLLAVFRTGETSEDIRQERQNHGTKAAQEGGLWSKMAGRSARPPERTTSKKSESKSGSATAVCKDGSSSYSQHRSGTCSGHGGVEKWLEERALPATGEGRRP